MRAGLHEALPSLFHHFASRFRQIAGLQSVPLHAFRGGGPFRSWGCLPWKASSDSAVMPFTANVCYADQHLVCAVEGGRAAA